MALFHDFGDDFVPRQGLTGRCQNLADDVCHHSFFVTPLGKGVNSASYKHKPLILDEFVVDSFLVGGAIIKFMLVYEFRDLRVMLGLAMVLEDKKCFIPHIARLDFVPVGKPNFAKWIGLDGPCDI